MGKKWLIIIVLVAILAILAVYFSFFFTTKCKERACFNNALKNCGRVSYINNAEDATWFYKIKPSIKNKEDCRIYVKLLKLKEGTTDLIKLEGEDMICLVSKAEIREPQDDLRKCSGKLKEEMQNILIERLHLYIKDNLGKIAEELQKPL